MQAVLRIPYAEKDAAKIAAREAGGRLSWNGDTKTWTFDGPALPALLRPYRQDSKRARTFLLDVPFEARSEAQQGGGQWSAEHKAWIFRGVDLPPALEQFRSAPYSWERWREDEINDGTVKPPKGDIVLTPRPHQTAAVRTIAAAIKAGRTGFLLADDVGLGKTISAWEAAVAVPDAETILIVCPLAVVPHWRRTISLMGDRGKHIVVINYDRLAKLFEAPEAPKPKRGAKKKPARRVSKRTQNKRLASKGEVTAFDVVILDEAHRLRNPTTLRSKMTARLVAEAQFTLWLSATAGQNPLELSYLAPLLAEVTGSKARDLADFERWCQDQGIGVARGAFGKWVWDRESETAEADLERMREILFTGRVPAGLRRCPEDIAGWPEINRIPWPVELEGANRRLYDAEWDAFRRALRLAGGGAKGGRNALVAQLRFRQKASLLRVAGTVALAEDLRENGRQVAISVQFIESLEAIAREMEAAGHRVSVIHGDQKPAERERERVRFQRGETTVVVYTVEEGISLHAGEKAVRGNRAPRATILHDARYSAIALAQIEGRCHRDGQAAAVYYVYGEDTVEERIVTTMLARLSAMKTMIGDDTATVREIEALLAREAAVESRAA